VDDWVWVRVQVQQRGVGVHRARRQRGGTLGHVHPQVPGGHSRRDEALTSLASNNCIPLPPPKGKRKQLLLLILNPVE